VLTGHKNENHISTDSSMLRSKVIKIHIPIREYATATKKHEKYIQVRRFEMKSELSTAGHFQLLSPLHSCALGGAHKSTVHPRNSIGILMS
jgi:hypothetical protein